jgi:hypothetical protein
MRTAEENVAALEAAIKKIKDAQQAEASAIVVKPREISTGRFSKKPKMTLAQKSAQTLHRVLQKKDEAGKTLEERVATHLLETSLTVGAKDLMGGAKCLETVLARVHGRVKPSQEEMDKDVSTTNLTAIYIGLPPLPCSGEIEHQPTAELKPHFDGEMPFINAEVVEQNPRLTAEQLRPEAEKPKPTTIQEITKVWNGAEERPNPRCRCIEDSPMYCSVHPALPGKR